ASERAIALVDAEDAAAGEEAVAQVANRALDLALVLGTRNRTQLWLDAHLRAQREQRRVKPYCGTDALEDDSLGIIEQPLPRDAAEPGGRADQRTDERMHREVEHELGPQRARVR